MDIVQPMPPMIKVNVYSTVETPTVCLAYVGKIGSNAEMAVPCNNIPGNNMRWRFITSTI